MLAGPVTDTTDCTRDTHGNWCNGIYLHDFPLVLTVEYFTGLLKWTIFCSSRTLSSLSEHLPSIDLSDIKPSALSKQPPLNTLRQNGRHFPDDIFKLIFLNENVWILMNISLQFVSKGPINNIPTLVQVMAWRRPGDKPISPEGYEEWHPHNWPVTTTNHLPPHLANYLGHQRVSVFV